MIDRLRRGLGKAAVGAVAITIITIDAAFGFAKECLSDKPPERCYACKHPTREHGPLGECPR